MGLAARGLVYVLIGILALQIAFVDRAERADQQGAFQTLAQNGFGKAILWLVFSACRLWPVAGQRSRLGPPYRAR